jgi:DNA-binding CsgD family transcriptional regulator/PAS domain-containing protein
MNPHAPTPNNKRLSELIGAIYDCAVEPDRWDRTLDDIRDFLVCANSVLYIQDTATGAQRYSKMVGIEPHWQKLMIDYGDHITEIYDYVGDAMTRPIDKVFVLRREVPDEILRANFYFRNWAVPQGIDDLMQLTLMRESHRMSALAMGRYRKDGRITDFDIQLLQLLAPHLRRAVAISDLIDMQTLRAEAVCGTLDKLAAAIILVSENGVILHANHAARQMLGDEHPLREIAGKIHASEPVVTRRLIAAIASAMREEVSAGDAGLGIALTTGPMPFHFAHILPITRGDIRARFLPSAVAAIFVASNNATAKAELRPIAEAFGLTPAEMRLLDRIVRGETLDQASAALHVAKTTSRTHLARILAKTGTRRQTSLLSLVYRLCPGLHAVGQS